MKSDRVPLSATPRVVYNERTAMMQSETALLLQQLLLLLLLLLLPPASASAGQTNASSDTWSRC